MAKLETKKMLAAAVAAAEDKQAVDLKILELDPAESGLTDYFLVMSGTNSRQMQSLADEIEMQLKQQFGNYANSREGYRQAEWILLDYVDFVVHIFSEEKRSFYDIERLRKSAHSMTAAELRSALVERTDRVRKAMDGGGDARSAVETPRAAKPARKAGGKKTSGTKRAGGIPVGKKTSLGKSKTASARKAATKKAATRKSAARKSTRIAGSKAGGSAAGRGKPGSRNKAAPKSTPKSRKRS